MYKMKHMISQIKPGSTNESPFWHKIFNFDSFVLQNLICSAYDFFMPRSALYSFSDFFYISASDLNRFPRFCKSDVIWMR